MTKLLYYCITPRRQHRRRSGSRRVDSMPSPLLPWREHQPASDETPSRTPAGTPSSHGDHIGPILRPSLAPGQRGPSSPLPLLQDSAYQHLQHLSDIMEVFEIRGRESDPAGGGRTGASQSVGPLIDPHAGVSRTVQLSASESTTPGVTPLSNFRRSLENS